MSHVSAAQLRYENRESSKDKVGGAIFTNIQSNILYAERGRGVQKALSIELKACPTFYLLSF